MSALAEGSLNELVAPLDRIDRQTLGGEQLTPALRQRVVQELERCLVDRGRLKLYTHVLQQVLNSRPRYIEGAFLEDDVKREDVTQHGLRVLDDAALVRFSLNAVALWTAHDYVRDCVFTEYWMGVVAQNPGTR